MTEVKYLFITGCARSGTTLMADLIRAHEQVAMGRERYANRYYYAKDFGPALFEKERFCRHLFFPEDSHHETLQPYYNEVYSRFDACVYRGDKIPEMALDYEPLFRNFRRPFVIYMLRDVLDVARSFEGRAAMARQCPSEQGWPPDRDWLAAIDEWNVSLANTIRNLEHGNFFVMRFEDLFERPDLLPRLLRFLGLPNSPALQTLYEEENLKSRAIQGRRVHLLDDKQVRLIQQNADYSAFERILSISTQQLSW